MFYLVAQQPIQCDQMLELKVAQMFPKVAQKAAKVVYTYK